MGFSTINSTSVFLVQIWGYGKPQLEKWKNLIVGWKPQTIEKREWGSELVPTYNPKPHLTFSIVF